MNIEQENNTSHLDALIRRAEVERAALAKAVKPTEITQRRVWLAQIEKEMVAEYAFLGIEQTSDNEILAALAAQ